MRLSGARVGAGIAVLATASLVVPSAYAATIEVSDGTAIFTAAPGETNNVQANHVQAEGSSDKDALKVTDSGAHLIVGPGCERLDDNSAACPEALHQPLALVAWAGDGSDRVFVSDQDSSRDVTVYGQGGKDTVHVDSRVGSSPLLVGGEGDDDLSTNMNGSDVPILRGGPGNDVLFLGGAGGGQEFGGSGDDRLGYSGFPLSNPLRLDGGRGDDTYTFEGKFTPGAMVAGPGFDTLDESTAVSFTEGLDFDMSACPGCVDRVIGTLFGDHLTGDDNPQAILGGAGDDVLNGGGGPDLIAGQDGDDTIVSRDGTIDAVGCGAGRDKVVAADRFDLVDRDCETVSRSAAPRV